MDLLLLLAAVFCEVCFALNIDWTHGNKLAGLFASPSLAEETARAGEFRPSFINKNPRLSTIFRLVSTATYESKAIARGGGGSGDVDVPPTRVYF